MKKAALLLFVVLISTVFKPRDVFPISLDVGANINKPVKNLKEIKSKYVVKQSMDYSCGPASLATLLSYYFADTITEQEIIKYLLLTTDLEKVEERKGFSLLDLKNFAQMRGYTVTGYRMDLEYLVSLDKPVLIPIDIKDYTHFVIFRGLKGDRVFLADPALGNVTMKVERFLSLWRTSVGLVVSKPNKRFINSPLEVTEEEKAIFADPEFVRKIFGVDAIGKIYGDGEF